MAKQPSIKNTSDLRKMLLETIEGVRRGEIEPRQANSIAIISRQILQSAKMDLDMMRFNLLHEDAAAAGQKVLQLVAS